MLFTKIDIEQTIKEFSLKISPVPDYALISDMTAKQYAKLYCLFVISSLMNARRPINGHQTLLYHFQRNEYLGYLTQQ